MIWRLEYENAHGDVARLDIQRGAATPVEIIEGTENPFLLSYELEDKSKKGFIMSSFADISIYETATFNIDDLKTLDETALSVKWYINSVLEWTGFVVPDFFSRTIGEPAIVNLAASDRLSSLEDATLDGLSEYITLRDLAIACLAKTGLTLPLNTVVDFTERASKNVMDAFALSERLEDDKGKKISCFDVLRSILVLTNSTIRQRKGQWRIYNKIQHEALTPSLNFDEVYQGAKRTIQPVFSSVGAFQEFGGGKRYPINNDFQLSTGWTAKNGFVFARENREVIGYTFTGSMSEPTCTPIYGDATDNYRLANNNDVLKGNPTDIIGSPYLESTIGRVPYKNGSVKINIALNAVAPNVRVINRPPFWTGAAIFYAVIAETPTETLILTKDGAFVPIANGKNNFQKFEFIPSDEEEETAAISKGGSITGTLDIGSSEYYNIRVRIYGSGSTVTTFLDSISFSFSLEQDIGKGVLYRTDQIGSFSKKSNPDTTIFGDYISSGLNGYFYPYSKDDTSLLRRFASEGYPSFKWTTATDPAAGELPILQHVTRQISRMFGVAHNVLSAVIDAKTFDPLAIVTNCAGEKYVIVYSVFDFLRSTVEVELQQIAYGSLQRRDFIFSYFGGGDGDGISSIGSVSGGSSSSGGGGSFLDKYFSFDEANDALVANVNLVSEKEIAAYFADGSIPSIFDNLPFATSAKVGGIKAATTYQNGIRINSSGFLEVDPSYAGGGVSSWNDLTNRPAWLTPTTKALFEAAHGHTWGQITSKPTSFPPTAHNHTIGDITGLQGALDGKEPSFTKNTAFNKNFGTAAGTVAQGNDSRINNGQTAYGWGNHASIDYARKGLNETITGTWQFRGSLQSRNADNTNIYTELNTNALGSYIQLRDAAGQVKSTIRGYLYSNFLDSIGIGISSAPSERLHVVGNGLFTGNLKTVEGNIEIGGGLITYDPINDTIRFNKTVVSDFDIVAFTDSGQSLPSIFDNLPKTSKTSFGVVKVGAGINVSGGVISLDIGSIAPQTLSFNGVDNKLSISGGNTVDLSGLTPDLTGYATENWVQLGFKPIAYQPTWGQITGKPTTFPPTAHNHTIGDITGLQGALDGKEPSFTKNTAFNKNFGTAAGTVAQGNDSRINNGQTAYGWGNHASIDYARKGLNETITGTWQFRGSLQSRNADNTNIYTELNTNALGSYIQLRDAAGQVKSTIRGYLYSNFLDSIGIGISSAPSERLHVVGNGLFTGNLTANNGTFTGLKIGVNDVATESWIQNTGTAYNALRLGGHLASLYPRRNVAETITGSWTFNGDLYSYKTIGLRTAGNATRVNLAATNSYHSQSGLLVNAGLGTTDGIGFQTSAGYGKRTLMKPNGDWDMAGNLTAQGEVTAYSSSDQRLKKNIKTIESAIDTINKLNPVSFNWNDKAIELNSAKDPDRVNYGLIAQEIERVLPELVHDTNGYKSVDYPQLFGIFIRAIQELNLKIKE